MDPRGYGTWRWAALATLPALALLAWQVHFVWPFFSDDAFISLRYSERLLAGAGLTWTDGERVEGYSNLLWVLLCSLLGALGLDLVTAARLLGGAATAVALWAIAVASGPHDVRSALRAAGAPLLAASTQVAMGWTLGGLEGPLVLCWLACGGAALLRQHARTGQAAPWTPRGLVLASVPFALLCWTRPDGPLWVATTAGVVAAASLRAGARPAAHRAFAFAALPALAATAQLLFRLAYHGDVVPNTAHVKAAVDPTAWPAGLGYVGSALAAHPGLGAAAAAGGLLLLLRPGARSLAWVLGLPLLAWLLYLAAIGGDHFPCRRLLHGAVAPMALLAGAGLHALGPRRRGAAALLLAAAAGWNVQTARSDAQSLELRGEVWEWQGREVGLALRAAFGDVRPRLAVDAAGAVPFYSGLPALDLLGLCDRTIATTPLPAWLDTVVPGTPRPPGHLRGNGRYVLDRAPDLLLFGPPPGRPLPVFVSGAELEDDPRFLHGHRLVLVDLGPRTILPGIVTPLTVPLWVRIDGAAGVGREAGRITIPAWLFGSFALRVPLVRRYQAPPTDPAEQAAHAAQRAELLQWLGAPTSVAVPDERGRLHAHFPQRYAALQLELPAGTYRAAVLPPTAGVAVRCLDAGPGGTGPTAPAPGFTVAADGRHQLQVQIDDTTPLPVRIERIELVRTDR